MTDPDSLWVRGRRLLHAYDLLGLTKDQALSCVQAMMDHDDLPQADYDDLVRFLTATKAELGL